MVNEMQPWRGRIGRVLRAGPSRRRLFDIGTSLGARGLEAGAKFGLYALAARGLGGHDAGRFFLALSLVHIVGTLGRLGLEKPLTRHVAAELGIGRPRDALDTALRGGLVVLAASTGAAILLATIGPVVAREVLSRADLEPVLWLIALIVPIQNTAYAMAYVLIGLERSVAAQVVMNALTPLVCLIAMVFGVRSLDGLLTTYALAYAGCVVLGGAVLLAEIKRPRVESALQHAPLPSLRVSAMPLFVVETAQAALLSVPVLLLGAFADPTSVSVFSLCNRLSMLVATVVLSLGAMAAPAYARHYRLGQWAALRREDDRNRLASASIGLPLILALAVGAAPLLNALGVDPAAGVPVLLILLAGQLVFCLLPSQDLILAMAGEGRVLRTLSLWQLALCTCLCVLVIPIAGPVGAALVSSGTWMLGAISLALAVRRRIPQLRQRAGEPV